MWKPGTAKLPPRPSPSNDKKSPKTPTSGDIPKSGSTSSTKKRLTGATLNMRFMKRKKETQQHEPSRSSQSSPHQHHQNNNALSSPASAQSPLRKHDDDAMEVVEEDVPFSRATPSDMYGMQASLPGRRSFGGFNPAMEEAWKDSKAMLENIRRDKPNQKVTDEELIQRYEDIVKQRSDKASRPIGNLSAKKKQKQR